ncbi:hypothetical protein JST56_04375 [Candidatus Dependentiae bacterium]|jgi:hypothetical protein|nr:hypothetical protein [Candidatus Dependentiae bacterium]
MAFRFHTSLRTRCISSFTWLQMCSITLISLSCLVLIWFFCFKNPIDQQVLNQLRELKLLQEKIAILQAEKNAFSGAVSKELLAKQELSMLIKDLPPIRVQLDSLMNLLQQNSLTCRVMTPSLQEDTQIENFVGYLIQTTAYGSFQAIYQFLDDLAANRQFVPIWISVQKKRQHRLELQFYCKVLAQSEERQ